MKITTRQFIAVASAPLIAGLLGCRSTSARPAVSGASIAGAEQRMADLKLSLPRPNQASATLRPAVVAGKLVFVSGHVSRTAAGNSITGRVGDDLSLEAGKAAARECGLSILATLRHALGSLDRVRRVVKVLGM